MHRSVQPWGLVLSLALVLALATTARALGGLVAWIGFVVGLGVTVSSCRRRGPAGTSWCRRARRSGWCGCAGSVVVAIVAMLLPRSWFSDAPRPPRRRQPTAPDADVAGEPGAAQ